MTVIAIPNWQGRVSPVFDVAEQVLVVEFSEGAEVARRVATLSAREPELRADQLESLHIDVLICCAISASLQSLLTAKGIEVIPHLCGDFEEVLNAYRNGDLSEERYAMPGCCGARVRQQQRRGRCRKRRTNQ
jgi:predicted Fe-Mo cluster-binding NifX family protein